MEINDLLGHEKGDIITLSDLQTVATYGKTGGLDLEIHKVVKYTDGQLFTYTGYLATESDQTFMLMIRQVDDASDIILYYLDQEEEAQDYYGAIIDEDGENFEKTFEVSIEGTDIEWELKSSMFGIEIEIDGEKEEEPLSIAEYGTNDKTNNPLAFLVWSGIDDEWLEIWYGCSIQKHEVNILSIK